jgi:hypothetical protein
VLYVPKTALRITGESIYFSVKAESGREVSRGFCPACGSPLFIQAELAPELQGVWASSLDDPGQFQPSVQVWTGSAQPWDCLSPSLPSIEKAPTEDQFHAILASSTDKR